MKNYVVSWNVQEVFGFFPDFGLFVGLPVGAADGWAEGAGEGLAEGAGEGLAEGLADGLAEGLADGLAEGLAEGLTEGAFVRTLNKMVSAVAPVTAIEEEIYQYC